MITIDGTEVPFVEGQTILHAAIGAGIYIPTLCYHPCLPEQSACRICVVEVEGARSLCASCSYPVTDGMVIYTNSERVIKARMIILELLLRSHELKCVVCDKNGT
jgi:NADH dehydrogenase/NADH:ubiquinone oxidoreductase subunit G